MTIGPALGAAFTLSLVYAGTDEYHQTFVAGRTGSPIDVAIDGLGAAVAVAILRRRERPRRGRPTGAAATRS
jgi:VanZ family protein